MSRFSRLLSGAAILTQLVISAGIPSAARAEESHPGIAIESMYSEAVLAFNKKQAEEALRILDQLLASAPNHLEALELKALTLKTKGDDARSLEVYEKLVQLKPAPERGPYHFEMGVILHRQKKFEKAKPHFTSAVQAHFNEVTSQLFLGLMAFNSGDLPAAQRSFEVVKVQGTTEFQVLSRYYLGLIHFKEGYGAGGMSELSAARSLASEVPESKIAQDIRGATEKVLAPFNSSQWFANVSFLPQYDSNIAQIPSVGELSPSSASGKSTAKLNLSAGAGYMSSPTQTLQWVASYRAKYNKNVNANAKNYEFFANTPSLYLNYQPLRATTGGLKLEGNFAFQNLPIDAGDTTGAHLFQKYSLGGEIGPFLKILLDRGRQLHWEAAARSTKYFENGDQSGTTIFSRLAYRGESSGLFNPGVTASVEKNGAMGADARYIAFGGGFSNSMGTAWLGTVTLSADLTMTKYSEAATPRSDRTLTGRMSFVRPLLKSWSLQGDFSYTVNTSSLPESYSYNRMVGGVGVGWTM